MKVRSEKVIKNVAGKRIKEARLRAKPKITQVDLSARLEFYGVILTDSAIGKIENGVSAVTDVQLVAFARALKVSTAWLLGEE